MNLSDPLSGVLDGLPPTQFAMAYGSGVFPQVGYNAAESESSMIDMIVATEDPVAWHAENMEMNPSHYFFLWRWLGPSVVAHLQEGFGAGLWYNTLVPLKRDGSTKRRMKYGVMSVKTLIDDLLNWRTLYVSGRMHKPVRILKFPSSESLGQEGGALNPTTVTVTAVALREASKENLRHAVRAALLLLPATFSERQLYLTIASLSYMGDFRMVFGENPDKVSNIVDGSMAQFSSLYRPILESSFPTVNCIGGPSSVEDPAPTTSSHPAAAAAAAGVSGSLLEYRQDMSIEARLAMAFALPHQLQKRMASSSA